MRALHHLAILGLSILLLCHSMVCSEDGAEMSIDESTESTTLTTDDSDDQEETTTPQSGKSEEETDSIVTQPKKLDSLVLEPVDENDMSLEIESRVPNNGGLIGGVCETTSCKPDQTCCGHHFSSTPKHICCGKNQVCLCTECFSCCTFDKVCGTTCCPDNSLNYQCILVNGSIQICCPAANVCQNGKVCCPLKTTCCGQTTCCTKAETCCGNECCNTATQQCCRGNTCCPKDDGNANGANIGFRITM